MPQFDDLKAWSGDNRWVYRLGLTQFTVLSSGLIFPFSDNREGRLQILEGAGWVPGTYEIIGTARDFNTPDGIKTMLCLNFVGNGAPWAGGTTNGSGNRVS